MKNHLFRIILVAASIITLTNFISCSEEDPDDLLISGATHFDPPAWIEGKWANDVDSTTYFYEFGESDFINKVQNTKQSFNYFINLSQTNVSPTERFVLIEEEKSNSRYKFQIKSLSTTLNFDFEKTSDSTMVDNENPVFESYARFN